MIAPEYLYKGSKIAIVATARKISKNEISDAVHYLRDMGFIPVYDERLLRHVISLPAMMFIELLYCRNICMMMK